MVPCTDLLRRVMLIAGFFSSVCSAQQSCPPPQIPTPDPRSDVFNDKQETDLGDAIADQIQRQFLVIDDEDLTGYVQKLGEKLLAQAPPMGMKVQFVLADFAQANALTLPGGRVYVSRKLVAMARSEDELAGVIGHELGHVLTRQPATRYTQLLRDALGITQAGTREEIFHNFELLQESVVKKRKAFARSGGEGKEEQTIADQVGIQLVSRAGYSAKAYADFFDRVTENQGKKGNWLSDVFGATKPDSKRFREMLKQTPALAAACVPAANRADASEFPNWQTAVVSYVGLGHKEKLQGVITKTKLDPPLQSDIRQIRFSPDGKYLLAQDDATIYVMTREPFAPLFTIYAPSANPANFTPDSESIVFYTDTLRVESWSVEDRTRNSANELTVARGCRQTELSPDGDYLACYGSEFDLSVYEVSSGTQVFQKKNFYQPQSFREFFVLYLAALFDVRVKVIEMHFSPDDKYLVAGAPDTVLGLDLESMQPVALSGMVKNLIKRDFAFLGPDKILGVDHYDAKNSALVKFPSGEPIKKLELGNQQLEGATNPKYALLRPVKDHPLGVMELESGKILLATDKAALDIFGDNYVRERTDGDMALLSISEKKEIGKAKLPQGQLGQLRAFAMSPDLHWMAISEKSRGGEWNLLQGKRIFYVRGFNSATIAADGAVDADFPEFKETKRSIAHLDPASGKIDVGAELAEQKTVQFGNVLLRTTHKGKDQWQARDLDIAGVDVKSNAVLWSHTYPKEAPTVLSKRTENNLVFSWPANTEGAKLEIKNNEDLAKRWPKMDASNEDYFLEAIEPRTGKIAGAAIIRTSKGAFRVGEAESAGDWLIASDYSNRLLVYSTKTGEQKGILFGRRPVISASMSLLTAENERGQLSLYDLNTLERREQYVFTSPIVYSYFAEDNRRLFVLTGNQTGYFIALPKLGGAAAATR